jgi:hypothetical protein
MNPIHLKATRDLRLCCAAALMTLLAACATPDARIQNNPQTFSSLPPDQQALIKQGKVGLGFSEAAVKLALGDPDRVTQRTDENGISTVWRYVEYETDAGTLLYTGYYHRYYTPYYGPSFGFPYYQDYPNRVERDVQRVVFRNGVVAAIEQELK